MKSLREHLSILARHPWYLFWRELEKRLYAGKEYTLQVPFGRRVLTPWFSEDTNHPFVAAMKVVHEGGNMMMTLDRAYLIYQMVCRAAALPGDMAECGVYQGSSAHLTLEILKAKRNFSGRLHLFDTFGGIPDFANPTNDYHAPGDYNNTSLSAVRHRLRTYGDKGVFHAGVIPDTFKEVADIPTYSFVNVDVSLSATNQACCEWFWPRLTPGGVFIVNDYGMYPYRNTTRPVIDAFFKEQGELPLLLPTGQAVIIKPYPTDAAKPTPQ